MPFLGIDIGTSATKVLILHEAGKILATAESPHTVLTPKPGWSEQHPEEWWTATIKATRTTLKKAQLKGTQIRAIGLSGQMHGSTFLNKSGQVLRPALLWNDQRTAAECTQIESLAGGRRALINMVSNPALTGFTAPKILWLRNHEPQHFAKLRQVLLPKDFIRYKLTHDYATEVSDASGTLLLNVKARTWHSALLTKLKLDPTLLPRLHESQQITGELTKEAAKLLNLQPGIPIVGGAGDQAAGAVGTGVVLPGLVSASMGTSGVIFAAMPPPKPTPSEESTPCVTPSPTPGASSDACSPPADPSNGSATPSSPNPKNPKTPGSLYPAMIQEAQQAPPGSENLFFLPYLTGERCPHPDPAARAAFIGLTPRHHRPHLIRAVLEGITFGMREQIQILHQMKIPIQQIRASGGGARSPFWRQLQADMYNAPVVTINSTEGAALGAAILAAVGTAHYNSVPEATAALIQIKQKSTPHKTSATFYAAQSKKYASLYPALKKAFPTLAG